MEAIGPPKTCELELETAAAVARVGLQVWKTKEGHVVRWKMGSMKQDKFHGPGLDLVVQFHQDVFFHMQNGGNKSVHFCHFCACVVCVKRNIKRQK